MAYSIDTRELVIRYLNNGHTENEANREFGICIPSMTKWRTMLRETGTFEDNKPERKPRKLHDEELRAYIAANLDAQFIEIAVHFGCSDEGVRKACKRLGITRKKKTRLYKERDEEKRQAFLDEIEDISP